MTNTITVRDRECSPLNKKSAMAISGGYAFESDEDNPLRQYAYDAPLNTQKVPRDLKNLIGTKRGRVTIVGYLGTTESKRGRNGKWLGKCLCGKYVMRMGRSWRQGLNKNEDDTGCAYCVEIDYLKYKSSILSLGKTPLSYHEWNRKRIHDS